MMLGCLMVRSGVILGILVSKAFAPAVLPTKLSATVQILSRTYYTYYCVLRGHG